MLILFTTSDLIVCIILCADIIHCIRLDSVHHTLCWYHSLHQCASYFMLMLFTSLGLIVCIILDADIVQPYSWVILKLCWPFHENLMNLFLHFPADVTILCSNAVFPPMFDIWHSIYRRDLVGSHRGPMYWCYLITHGWICGAEVAVRNKAT